MIKSDQSWFRSRSRSLESRSRHLDLDPVRLSLDLDSGFGLIFKKKHFINEKYLDLCRLRFDLKSDLLYSGANMTSYLL